MRHTPPHRQHLSPSLYALSLLLALTLAPSCSKKVIREYHPDGNLREMRFTGEDGRKYHIAFTYDQKQRTIGIQKTGEVGGTSSMEMKVRYAPSGKITFISRSTLVSPSAATRDVEFNSFTYSKSGEVTRIETSYKSAFSISKHRTALVTARYQHSGGAISSILVDGGTYRADMKLTRDDDELVTLEYIQKAYNWQAKSFQVKKHIVFHFDDGEPEKAVDKKENRTITSQREVEALYESEGIGAPLFRAGLGVHYGEFLDRADALLAR